MEFMLLLPQSFFVAFMFILGSCFGSFANVLIYRMQQEEPLDLFGRSACPHCRYKIPFYLNIPCLSWFFIKGRCKSCNEKISFRYPLVEFLTASCFALLFLKLGWSWFLLEALLFVFGLIVVSFIDFDQMILPDSFTLSGIVIGLLGAGINPERGFSDAFLGFFIGGFLLWLVAYIYFLVRKQEGMGGGDIKLLGWIGAVLGWKSISFVVVTSCLLGTFVSVFLMMRHKKGLDYAIPFGPYLALGAVLYIFFQDTAFHYVRFLIPFTP